LAYDEDLADRVRAALGPVTGVTEIKMFGGLCFTVGGNMTVGVTKDDLMVRLPADETEAALSAPGARPMDFTGTPMRGFVFVGPEGLSSDASLRGWVDRGVAYASSLPPKRPKPKRPAKPRT
jgi:hypothetical protein